MSSVVLLRRATLLIPSGPAHDIERKHLFVLLTEPFNSPGNEKEVLLASISSIPESDFYDQTCVLQHGDHPFIRHESYVEYARVRIEKISTLKERIEAGIFIIREIMKPSVVDRICQGLEYSDNTPEEILDFYRAAIK